MNFQLFQNEADDLITFLTANKWPFHQKIQVTEDEVLKNLKDGYYENDRETFWLIDNGMKIGLIILNDMSDNIPIIDIRIEENYRSKGYGVTALNWVKEYLFSKKDKIRIEGYTRADNIAMRKCFTKAGFVKEGYLRSSWENADGTLSDTIIYAAIKEDWVNDVTTPIKLNEVPY